MGMKIMNPTIVIEKGRGALVRGRHSGPLHLWVVG